MKATHHATVEKATESDNEVWVYVDCDPDEHIEDPDYTEFWDYVNCKRCLKNGPRPTKPPSKKRGKG